MHVAILQLMRLTVTTIPKAWPASNVGAPHSRGHGIFILPEHVQESITNSNKSLHLIICIRRNGIS